MIIVTGDAVVPSSLYINGSQIQATFRLSSLGEEVISEFYLAHLMGRPTVLR